jgi:F-type H+-transporting ATPase subunit gamma
MRSVLRQYVVQDVLLPFAVDAHEGAFGGGRFLYEPARTDLLRSILERFLAYQVYGVLAESFAAELAARMSAMDNAARNAQELIDKLTLAMNKARQGMITRELADIVGASEGVK